MYLVELHIYYKMIHGPYNINLTVLHFNYITKVSASNYCVAKNIFYILMPESQHTRVNICTNYFNIRRSQWPRGLRHRSATGPLLKFGFESHRGHEWSVCCECCLCDELITRPEESYRLWCVAVCDLETS